MRICSVDEEGRYGGPEKRIIVIANSLKKCGIITHILYPKLDSGRFSVEIKKLDIKSTPIFLTRLSKEKKILFRYIFFFFYEVFIMYRFFIKNKFDLVQINGSQQFKGALAARLANIPIIWLLEDTMMDLRIKKICQNLIYHLASGIIVVASRVYKYYIKGTRLELVPCVEIHTPTNTSIFNPKVVPVLKNLSIGGKTIITTVSGLNPTKGVEYFIEMAYLLLKENKDLLFLIAGAKLKSHSRYVKKIEEVILKKKIQNKIIFLGLIEEIPSLLKISNIFVCSSIAEASPTAVWEAMAMEKPIVTTDVGSVNKYISNGESGYIVPTKNAKELYKKVNKLLKNPEKMKSFGRKARKIAETELDITIAVEKYNNFYKKIVLDEV